MNNTQPPNRNALILANTYIKNPALDKCINRLKEKLELVQINYEIFIDNYPSNLDGYTEIIIMGGDGSINHVVNKYQQIDMPISIIPLGTGNDLYASLNNNLDVEQSLNIAINGKPHFIDAAMCNKYLFLNTFSVGFDAKTTLDSNKIAKYVPKKFKYALAILKNILFYKADNYAVNYKANRYTQITLMNGPQYGSGVHISPNSNLSDGKMELIMLNEITNFFTKIKFFLKLKSGKHIYDKLCNVKEIYDKVIIICMSDTVCQIDGECHKDKYFDLKILPKYYQIKI